jgi:hypothetical protein
MSTAVLWVEKGIEEAGRDKWGVGGFVDAALLFLLLLLVI